MDLCDDCQGENGSDHVYYKYGISFSSVRRTKKEIKKSAIVVDTPHNRSFASYVMVKAIRTYKNLFTSSVFFDRQSVVLLPNSLQDNLQVYVKTEEWAHHGWTECFVEVTAGDEDSAKVCPKNLLNVDPAHKDFLSHASVAVVDGVRQHFSVLDGVFLYNSPSSTPPTFVVVVRKPFRDVVFLAAGEESESAVDGMMGKLSAQWTALNVSNPILRDSIDEHPPTRKGDRTRKKYCWSSNYSAFFLSEQPLTYGQRKDICRRIGHNVYFLKSSSKDMEFYTISAGAIVMNGAGSAGIAQDGDLMRRTLIVACDIRMDCVGYCMNATEDERQFLSGCYPLDASLDVSCAIADVVSTGYLHARLKRGVHVDSVVIYVPSSMEKKANTGLAESLDRVLKQAFKKTPEINRPVFAVVAVQSKNEIFEETISERLSESECEDPSSHEFFLKLHFGHEEDATATKAAILLRSTRIASPRRLQEMTQNLCISNEEHETCLQVPLPLFKATKVAEEKGKSITKWKFYCRKEGDDESDNEGTEKDEGEFDESDESDESGGDDDDDDAETLQDENGGSDEEEVSGLHTGYGYSDGR